MIQTVTAALIAIAATTAIAEQKKHGAEGDWRANRDFSTLPAAGQAPDAKPKDADATPPDDSGKWHFMFFSQKSCTPCEELKALFSHDPDLKAWANPQQTGWCHWHEIRIDDKDQKWRINDWQVTTTPTIVITTPVNSATWPYAVVYRRTAPKPNPTHLAAEISATIDAFVTAQTALLDVGRPFRPPATPSPPAVPKIDPQPNPPDPDDSPPPVLRRPQPQPEPETPPERRRPDRETRHALTAILTDANQFITHTFWFWILAALTIWAIFWYRHTNPKPQGAPMSTAPNTPDLITRIRDAVDRHAQAVEDAANAAQTVTNAIAAAIECAEQHLRELRTLSAQHAAATTRPAPAL